MESGAGRERSVSRLNILIAVTAAIIGLIYGYNLGSPATFTLLGILLFTVGFNFGYGSLVWVYASESFPCAAAHPGRIGHARPRTCWRTSSSVSCSLAHLALWAAR